MLPLKMFGIDAVRIGRETCGEELDRNEIGSEKGRWIGRDLPHREPTTDDVPLLAPCAVLYSAKTFQEKAGRGIGNLLSYGMRYQPVICHLTGKGGRQPKELDEFMLLTSEL